MFFVYVLRSVTTSRHYIGFTSDLGRRLMQHNAGVTKSTKNRGPWELVYQESVDSRSAAMRRERFFKSGQGREQLEGILSGRDSAG